MRLPANFQDMVRQAEADVQAMNWHFDRFVSVAVTLVILAIQNKVTWVIALSVSLGWLISIAMIVLVTWVWHMFWAAW